MRRVAEYLVLGQHGGGDLQRVGVVDAAKCRHRAAAFARGKAAPDIGARGFRRQVVHIDVTPGHQRDDILRGPQDAGMGRVLQRVAQRVDGVVIVRPVGKVQRPDQGHRIDRFALRIQAQGGLTLIGGGAGLGQRRAGAGRIAARCGFCPGLRRLGPGVIGHGRVLRGQLGEGQVLVQGRVAAHLGQAGAQVLRLGAQLGQLAGQRHAQPDQRHGQHHPHGQDQARDAARAVGWRRGPQQPEQRHQEQPDAGQGHADRGDAVAVRKAGDACDQGHGVIRNGSRRSRSCAGHRGW